MAQRFPGAVALQQDSEGVRTSFLKVAERFVLTIHLSTVLTLRHQSAQGG